MENKDYVLHVNWHSHRVGTLAWVDERFYLTQRKEKELKEARADGYDGIPGFDFKKNKIYQSGELFDCFLRKTLKKTPVEQCEDLISSSGNSFTDSFTLTEVKLDEKMMEGFKKRLVKRCNDIQKRGQKEGLAK